MAIINRKIRQFSDINLVFNISSSSLDITKKTDEEAIKSSIKNLIQTKNFERPFHPEIGCQLHALLFENYTPVVYQTVKKTIFDVIEKFEPRVSVLDVKIQQFPDSNEINVDVVFKINNTDRPTTLRTTIQRVR